MRRITALLPRLIAIVLLLQTVMAPAHCLAHAAMSGFAVVVCTDDGYRSVHLTPDGDEAPAPDARPGFCAACHSLPAAPVFAVPVLPPPAWAMLPIAWHAAAAAQLPPRARAPPFEPTGPPASLS